MKRYINNGKLILSFLFLVLFINNAFPIDRVSTGTGNWNTAGTWLPSGVPAAGDNITIAAGHTVTVNAAGNCNNLIIEDGATLQLTTLNLTVNGTTNISGTLNDNSATGVNTFIGLVTVNSGGSWTTTASTTATRIVFRSGLTNEGTFNAAAASFNTNSQTISGSQPLTFTGAVTITGAITVTNANTNANGVTVNGVLNGTVAGSTFLNQTIFKYGNSTQPMATGVLNASYNNNTVNYSRTNTQTIKATTYYHLIISGSNTKTLGGNITVNGNLTISAGYLSTSTYTITGTSSGTFTISNNARYYIYRTSEPYFPTNMNMSIGTTSYVYYSANSSLTLPSTPTTYGYLYIAGTGTKSLSSDLTVQSSLNVNASSANGVTLAIGSYSLTCNGTVSGNSAISMTTGNLNIGYNNSNTGNFSCGTGNVSYTRNGSATVKGTTYYNLFITGSGTKTLGGATTINNNLTINGGTLSTSTYQITGNSSGAFSMAASTSLILGSTGSATVVNFPTNFTNISLNATSTVSYSGNYAQTISSIPTYGNLTISTGTTAVSKTSSSNLNIAGNLTINTNVTLPMTTKYINLTGNLSGAGALSFTTGNLNIGGNNSQTGTFTCGTGTVTYNGTGTQTVRGTTYYNLTIDKSAGTANQGATTIVSNLLGVVHGTMNQTSTLTLNNFQVEGIFNSANTITVSGTTTISGNLNITSTTGTKTFSDITITSSGIWSNTANEAVTINGNLNNNSTNFSSGTAAYTLAGTDKVISSIVPFTIIYISCSGTYTNNAELTATTISIAGTLTNNSNLTVNTTLNGAGTLIQGSNASLYLKPTTIAITNLNASANPNIVNYSGASQTIMVPVSGQYHHLNLSGTGNKTLGGNIKISGDFTHKATLVHNNMTLTMNGTSNQTIYGTSIPYIYELVVNKPGNELNLETQVNAITLTLTSGIVNTNSTNYVNVIGALANNVVGGSSSSYIRGPFVRVLPASLVTGSEYLFPIGKGTYNPFELINPTTNSGGTCVIKAEVFDESCGGSIGSGLCGLNTDRYWYSELVSGNSNFTSSQIRLTQTGVTNGTQIGQSSTKTGSYNNIGGTVNSNTVSSTQYINTLDYFALATGPSPSPFNVTGGGVYCTGGNGLPVGLDSSEVNVDYQLYLDGNPIGSTVAGTGNPISFGLQTVAGTYTVSSEQVDAGCPTDMTGNAVITISNSTEWMGSVDTNWDNINNWSAGIPASGADVVIASSSNIPIIAATASTKNLTINAGAGLTIQASGNLTVNGDFTIETPLSDAASGSFIDIGAYSVTGNIFIKRYYYKNRYFNISSPVPSATMAVIDAANTNAGIFYYNTLTDAYIRITNSGTPMEIMKGYSCKWITAYSGNMTFVYTGTPNTGDQTANIIGGGSGNGWNLVGNPYPSTIDWKLDAGWARDSVGDQISYRTNGVWATYNKLSDVSTNGGTRYIQPMQGFWVKSNLSTNTITVKNAARLHRPSDVYLRTQLPQNELRVKVQNRKDYEDEAVLAFRQGATWTYDSYDSDKWFMTEVNYPQLYFFTGNKNVVSNVFPTPVQMCSVPMGFKTAITSSFTLTFSGMETFAPNTTFFLEDKVTGTFTNLTHCNTYTFNSGIFQGLTRFVIHIYTNEVSPTSLYSLMNDSNMEGENLLSSSDEFSVFYYSNQIQIQNPNLQIFNANIAIFEMTGKKVYQEFLETSEGSLEIPVGFLSSSSIYLYKINIGNKTIQGRFFKD